MSSDPSHSQDVKPKIKIRVTYQDRSELSPIIGQLEIDRLSRDAYV